jgi:hypothetical protein
MLARESKRDARPAFKRDRLRRFEEIARRAGSTERAKDWCLVKRGCVDPHVLDNLLVATRNQDEAAHRFEDWFFVEAWLRKLDRHGEANSLFASSSLATLA